MTEGTYLLTVRLHLIKEGAVTADAIVFPDGVSVLHWRTDPASTEVYPSAEAMYKVREASGRSQFQVVLSSVGGEP